MDTQKQQIVESLKQANNVLVTVSSNPSVDQLAACIGLTLALNKMKKHATAVFSGVVPPIISFLEPEKTIEKTTDSLRDFIIAIDKAKADKLRYKVEDKFVKIFITPYRTSISNKDLEFSEGDFNVDVVLALGVQKQTDLDQAITAHGRILHDATVASINTQENIELGSISLIDTQAGSLSEIAVGLINLLDKSMIDGQIATALLTGIVAETDRFRNAKTTPTTMSISAELLTAGANQQLVASKLESLPSQSVAQTNSPSSGPLQQTPPSGKSDDGTLQIAHDEGATELQTPPSVPTAGSQGQSDSSQIHIDANGQFQALDQQIATDANTESTASPSLPPFPPAPPIAPAPIQPPLNNNPPSPSPLNPFARPSGPAPGGGLGLPPLSPPAGKSEVDSSSGIPPASPTSQDEHMPAPPIAPAPIQPPLYNNPPSPSPLNPFARPSGPAPGGGLGLPPLRQTMPPVAEPTIIQPDPNAAHAAQQGESLAEPLPTIHTDGPGLMTQPPTFTSQLNAGMMPEDDRIPPGPMSLPSLDHPGPLLERDPLQQQSQILPPPLGVPQASSMGLPPPPLPSLSSPTGPIPMPGSSPIGSPLAPGGPLSSLGRDTKNPQLDYIESPIPNLPPPPMPTSTPAPTPMPSITSPLSMAPPVSANGIPGATSVPAAGQDQEIDVSSARNAVNAAFQNGDSTDVSPLEPVVSLNAQQMGGSLHQSEETSTPPPEASNDPGSGSGMPPPPPLPPPMMPPGSF